MKNQKIPKKEMHRLFWLGKGPCLIFITTPELSSLNPDTETLDKYDTAGYRERFYSPVKMWESEIRRAKEVIDWPSDGIPTVRPNLGTVYIPAMAGQEYRIMSNQMPHVGAHLSLEQIKNINIQNVFGSEILKLSTEFYAEHSDKNITDIIAYHPDTQGVFDLAHLLYGDQIFIDMMTDISNAKQVMDKCSELFISISQYIKTVLGESTGSMTHGHGTPQGLFFPNAGVRMSEDSTTLISPSMIDDFVIPYIIKAAKPFGGIFIHYCGKHTGLFESVCALDCVKAIDLGNPEMYDLEWLLEICAQTDTVFYSRVSPEGKSETWESYIRRIAKILNKTKARCVLRTLIQPKERDECLEMLNMWHSLTI